jgi:hypothetical protein
MNVEIYRSTWSIMELEKRHGLMGVRESEESTRARELFHLERIIWQAMIFFSWLIEHGVLLSSTPVIIAFFFQMA